MSKTLIVNVDPRISNDSFILIRPTSTYYKIGEQYMIVDSSQLFQKLTYLKCVDTYKVKDIPEAFIYIDSNIPKQTFLDIQEKVYNTSQRVTLKEYPLFLVHLKDVLGIQDFKSFEYQIFKTFKPLTLTEILKIYRNSKIYISEKYKQLSELVDASFIEKELSVLTFASHVPVEIIKQKTLINTNFTLTK
jgi:hypothetical protein